MSLALLLFEPLEEACLGEERGEEKEDKVEDQGHHNARPVLDFIRFQVHLTIKFENQWHDYARPVLSFLPQISSSIHLMGSL